MEWNEESQNAKKGMSLSSKFLLGIIACIILIIILIMLLLTNKKDITFSIYLDEKTVTTSPEKLLTTIENTTYINIAEFAKMVGYEYHEGEYKSYTSEKDKCYVEGTKETATFYLNDNKVYKLPLNQREKAYEVYEVENTIQLVNEKMYAPLSAITKAFNVVIDEQNNSLKIYTLEYLIATYDTKATGWGYTSIAEQSFENDKALLYGYLIVKKEGGLYKIINLENTKEIVLDRYSSIEFSEDMQEFYVKDNYTQKVGIVKSDGTTTLEPYYESISVLDKETGLYLVKQGEKFGVVKSGNVTIIYPEFDSIGLNETDIAIKNKYLLLEELIPVCRDGKWGAYNKNGKLIINIENDGFGYELTSININGISERVEPVIEIERANGVVVKKEEKYGIIDIKGKVLVSLVFDSIYAIPGETDEDLKYFMIFNGNKMNVIKELIDAGYIKENDINDKEEIRNELINNGTQNNNMLNENVATNNTTNNIG